MGPSCSRDRASSETHCVWCVGRVDSLAVEEEAHALRALALPLAEGIHELLQLCGALNLEEHLVVVVRDLDVQMLSCALWLIFWLVAGGASVVCHVESVEVVVRGGVGCVGSRGKVERSRMRVGGVYIASSRLTKCVVNVECVKSKKPYEVASAERQLTNRSDGRCDCMLMERVILV